MHIIKFLKGQTSNILWHMFYPFNLSDCEHCEFFQNDRIQLSHRHNMEMKINKKKKREKMYPF